jgi:hypothetical protein
MGIFDQIGLISNAAKTIVRIKYKIFEKSFLIKKKGTIKRGKQTTFMVINNAVLKEKKKRRNLLLGKLSGK